MSILHNGKSCPKVLCAQQFWGYIYLNRTCDHHINKHTEYTDIEA